MIKIFLESHFLTRLKRKSSGKQMLIIKARRMFKFFKLSKTYFENIMSQCENFENKFLECLQLLHQREVTLNPDKTMQSKVFTEVKIKFKKVDTFFWDLMI